MTQILWLKDILDKVKRMIRGSHLSLSGMLCFVVLCHRLNKTLLAAVVNSSFPPMTFSTELFRIKVNLWQSVFFSVWYLAAALFWKQSLERVNGWYLSSLIPDQGGPRVVDGGQLRLRVLGEEERLLYSPQRGRRLAAQGSCRRPA